MLYDPCTFDFSKISIIEATDEATIRGLHKLSDVEIIEHVRYVRAMNNKESLFSRAAWHSAIAAEFNFRIAEANLIKAADLKLNRGGGAAS